jgi:hypothetical protein
MRNASGDTFCEPTELEPPELPDPPEPIEPVEPVKPPDCCIVS